MHCCTCHGDGWRWGVHYRRRRGQGVDDGDMNLICGGRSDCGGSGRGIPRHLTNHYCLIGR